MLTYPYPTLEAWIEDQLAQDRPDKRDYGYHGDTPLGVNYAICFSTHRDDDILGRSNWDVVRVDMLRRFPRSCHVETFFNHWAVGWVDHLMVKLITTRGEPTKAAQAMYDWLLKLADYPVADDDNYSELESEEYHNSMLQSVKLASWHVVIRDSAPDDWQEQVIEYIRENAPSEYDRAWDREGWFEEDVVWEAMLHLDLIDTEAMLDYIAGDVARGMGCLDSTKHYR